MLDTGEREKDYVGFGRAPSTKTRTGYRHPILTHPQFNQSAKVTVRTSKLSRTRTTTRESGLYNLILQSRKPQALKFKRWVTHEVLPAIRKTGGYIKRDEGKSEMEVLCNVLEVQGEMQLIRSSSALQQS